MDGRRFDKMTRALARWFSRRRLLKGLTDGAPLGIVGFGGTGNAGAEPDPRVLAAIAERSAAARDRMPVHATVAAPAFDPRLTEFVRLVRGLAELGVEANGWNADQMNGWLTSIRLIPLAVSAGTDAYLDRWAAERIGKIEDREQCPDLGLPEGEDMPPDRPTDCTTRCLDEWQERFNACGDDLACQADAFWGFNDCFLLEEGGNVCDDDAECMGRIVMACGGDCR